MVRDPLMSDSDAKVYRETREVLEESQELTLVFSTDNLRHKYLIEHACYRFGGYDVKSFESIHNIGRNDGDYIYVIRAKREER
jgi:hypothetical protein